MKKLRFIFLLMVTSISFNYAQNVGIGTTTPSEKLDVNGHIIDRGLAGNAGSYVGLDVNGKLVLATPPTSGATGATGATGPAGTNGTNGPTGPQGVQGIQGVQGLQGNQGVTGAQGVAGNNGTNGTNGAVGATGPPGSNGSNGSVGATGPAGTNGTNGSNGAAGATGPTGLLSSGTATGNTTYWNGSSWVLNSNNIYNNGGNVGIGTASPTQKLNVAGNIDVGTNYVSFGGDVTQNHTAGINWHTTGSPVGNYSIYRSSGAWTSNTYQQLVLDWPTGIVINPGNGSYGKSYVDVIGQLKIQGGSPGLGKVLTSDAVGLASWSSNGPSGITVFTSGSGTYNVPVGVTKLLVKLIGGGGSGGSASYSNCPSTYHVGAGGGAGGYCEGIIISPTSSYAYSVGSGGSPNVSTCGANGGSGTTTTFGSFVGNGGTGGRNSVSGTASFGGSGGTASGGSINLTGAIGRFSSSNSYMFSGDGAGSIFGNGGSGLPNFQGNSAGNSGISKGSGGGGSNSYNTGWMAGGSGAPGIIIIYEFK